MTTTSTARGRTRWTRRLALAGVVAMALGSGATAPAAVAKKPAPPPPSASCSFSTATGLTTCVTVAPEVFDHAETPALSSVACTDPNGDPSTRTRSRRDEVFRTDTTTTTYQGRNAKPATLVGSATTSTYRTVLGTVVLGPCTDVTAPDVTITAAPSGSTTATTAAVWFTADEPGTTFTCRLDDGTAAGCTSPATYTGLGLGQHTVTVGATDAAGNVDPTPAVHSWQVVAPPPAPTVTITDGPGATTSSPIATFTFSTSQSGTTRCRLDAGAFAACSSPHQVHGLGAGSHTFTVTVTNANGTGSDSRTWAVEATLPTCGAAVTSFGQLADGTFEVLGTDLGCLQYIAHVRAPVAQSCQGGGVYFPNPAFGDGSIWVRSWTQTRVVIDDRAAAGQVSICLGLIGELDGLEYPEERPYDHTDFVAGPDPFNVVTRGTVGDGLHYTAPVESTSPALPAAFVGARLVADLTHDPLTGFGCVPANGTWWYETDDGPLVHFTRYSSSYGSYCVGTGGASYSIYSRTVPTPGDALTATSPGLSFSLYEDDASGTFRTVHYGTLTFTAP